jgi:hypothetical protein
MDIPRRGKDNDEPGHDRMTVGARTTCSACGHEFPLGSEQVVDRPPCDACGHRGVTIQLGIASELNIASSFSLGVGPGHHDRDSAGRWRETVDEVSRLEQSLPEQPDNSYLLDAQRRLYHVFIELWALRESVIREGVSDQLVKAMLKGHPDGAALAYDLGNVAKHGPLTRPPMSPHKPTFGALQATRPGAGPPWNLSLEVHHGPRVVNALAVAREAVDQWEAALSSWGLI